MHSPFPFSLAEKPTQRKAGTGEERKNSEESRVSVPLCSYTALYGVRTGESGQLLIYGSDSTERGVEDRFRGRPAMRHPLHVSGELVI